MAMLTSGAAPCLSCGTTGGFVAPQCNRPKRTRGLCLTCYLRARRHGTRAQYPAAGARPVPYAPAVYNPAFMEPWQPAPWATAPVQKPCTWDTYAPAEQPTSAAQREDSGTMLWLRSAEWGYRRHKRAVRPSCNPAEVVAEAEAFAANWLARRQQAA